MSDLDDLASAATTSPPPRRRLPPIPTYGQITLGARLIRVLGVLCFICAGLAGVVGGLGVSGCVEAREEREEVEAEIREIEQEQEGIRKALKPYETVYDSAEYNRLDDERRTLTTRALYIRRGQQETAAIATGGIGAVLPLVVLGTLLGMVAWLALAVRDMAINSYQLHRLE